MVAAMFAAACAAPAFAESKTLKGEIIDQACYTKDKANRGDSHKDCGSSCAKKGSPLALITSTGEVYTITGDYAANKNAKLVDHFAHTVEVTGDVSEKDGKMSIAVATLKMAS
jgi:predicted lipoprotein with Yx(FWY)xxD motif